MKIKYQIDAEDAIAKIQVIAVRAAGAGRSGTSQVLHAIERQAKMNATINPKVRTGRLRSSIVVKGPQGGGGKWSGEVGPTVIYGRIQELGGTIFPKRAKFLHWVDASGDHFARHVTLPARPYLKPAAEMVTPMAGEIFAAEMAKAIAE